MRSGQNLLHIPVFLSAVAAILGLAGFPGRIHLTPFRILFILLVPLILIAWILFFRSVRGISSRRSVRALCFQGILAAVVLCLGSAIAGSLLSSAEGAFYRIGSFIRQADPFLLFLSVTGVCSLVLIYAAMKETTDRPLRTLMTENTDIHCMVVILAAVLFVYAAFIPIRQNYYPSHDYAIFSYIGQQILRGKIPFTEMWDHKPPVIFYLNALGLKLTNGELTGIWILEVTAFFIGALILFRLLKNRYPKWIALTVLSLGLLHYVRVLDFGNYTEEVSLFFVLCALGLYFGGRCKKDRLCGFLCGILCGLAFTSKQNTIGCWAALFLCDLIRLIPVSQNRDLFRDRLRFWLSAAAGFLLVNSAWVIYFAANHALEAYWDVAFRFNLIYSEKSGDSRLACAWTTLTFLASVSPFLLFGYCGWAASCWEAVRNGIRNFIEEHPLRAWALIDLPVELILAGLSGMNYQHYFILCILPLTILLCSLLSALSKRFIAAPKVFVSLTVLILCASSLPLIRFFRENYTPRMPSSYTKTRDYLLDETAADEPILVWGSRSAIYVMSSRYAPTAYFNERPLYLFPGDVRASQWEELLNDLEADMPQVIIYTKDSALPFIHFEKSGCSLPDMPEYTVPLYNYFCDNYRYETTINPEFQDAWEIYRRR